MFNKDSTSGTIIVAFVLCVVCSVLVSAAAVALRPIQLRNQLVNQWKSVLTAADLLPSDTSAESIEATFKTNISERFVELNTGKYVELGELEASQYDAKKRADDPALSSVPKKDNAKIGRRVDIAKVYVVQDGDKVKQVVFPVHGAGLWSTLYGFLAVKSDMNTVAGISFYEHGETPGLGDQILNPDWVAAWPGKKLYNEQGEPSIRVIKGRAKDSAPHDIDGMSGATLTGVGVQELVRFWSGPEGYGPYMQNIKKGEI